MNRTIVELRQLDERLFPDDDHLARGTDISPAEFDEWMERLARTTREFKSRPDPGTGQATIDALRSLKPTAES
jgi:hypothetical protein